MVKRNGATEEGCLYGSLCVSSTQFRTASLTYIRVGMKTRSFPLVVGSSVSSWFPRFRRGGSHAYATRPGSLTIVQKVSQRIASSFPNKIQAFCCVLVAPIFFLLGTPAKKDLHLPLLFFFIMSYPTLPYNACGHDILSNNFIGEVF